MTLLVIYIRRMFLLFLFMPVIKTFKKKEGNQTLFFTIKLLINHRINQILVFNYTPNIQSKGRCEYDMACHLY